MTEAALAITVHAGLRDRCDCPLRFTLPTLPPDGRSDGPWKLAAEDGSVLLLQRLDGQEVAAVERDLAAGSHRTYRLQPHSPGEAETPAVQLTLQGEESLVLTLRGKEVTRYHYRGVPARPYFYPLRAPNGVGLTRSFPMQPGVPGETGDHPHHRSLWIAFGDVDGVDNWSEAPGHGVTEHQTLDRLQSGDVCGRFVTTGLWKSGQSISGQGVPLLTQHLEVTTWATSDAVRLLDFDIRLTALQRDVPFGDTKEGGLLALRVASPLDVPAGGHIENSYGAVQETETWGKAAHWCDYSGVIDGKRVGVAVLDHPFSFRYPTHWHVRNYGLMAANPFGYAAYTQGQKDGSYNLPAGETLRFHYRVVLHTGDAAGGRVRERYLDFATPPRVTVP